jgi:hypothetical protein
MRVILSIEWYINTNNRLEICPNVTLRWLGLVLFINTNLLALLLYAISRRNLKLWFKTLNI